MTLSNSRVVLFAAALAVALMGCPDGGGGSTGGGSGSTGGSGGTTGGSGGTTGGSGGTTGGSGGTTGGSGGTTGGSGGTTGGSGGTTGGSGGTTGGSSGTTGGSGGTTGGSGGTTGGSGGTTGGSGGTTGGGTGINPTNCTEISLADYVVVQHEPDYDYVAVRSQVSPALGLAAPDRSLIELYGDLTLGSYTLGAGADSNYSTCARCVVVDQDLGEAGNKTFFQYSGTYVVSAVDATAGTITATLTDVTLIEVTIDSDTLVSTPVTNGACVHIASAAVTAAYTPPPSGWTCDPSYFNDSFCQCGCGVQDGDCAGSADVNECLGCACGASDADGGVLVETCDPANTVQCTGGSLVPWTCGAQYYGDGDCQCGCGAQDLDCAGTTNAAECTACGCAPQTQDGGFVPSDCSTTDTSQCTLGSFVQWSCSPSWYGDGSYCDCGCGGPDTDCAGTTDINECDDCSCGTSAADGGINVSTCDPANTAVCTAGTFIGWTCSPGSYDDGFSCDCGCGVQDPDCAGTTDVNACDTCGCLTEVVDGGINSSSCSASDTTQCTPTQFVTWSCNPSYYAANDGCDCGCGAVDLDCADAGIGACLYCNNPGSCTLDLADAGVTPGSTLADGGVMPRLCGYINPADNAVCQ